MDNLSSTGYKTGVSTGASSSSAAAYSLAAKVSVAREDLGISPSPQNKNTPPLDPFVLAKVAIEDEIRKRKGGGGGGGGFLSTESYNPTLWVPYSFKLMAQAMNESRAFFNQSWQQVLNLIPNTLNNIANVVNRGIANLGRSLGLNLTNMLGQLQRQASALLESAIKAPMNLALSLGSNVSHLANTIANALSQGLRRLVYGKDEKDELENENKKDSNNLFDSFSDWIKNLRSDNN